MNIYRPEVVPLDLSAIVFRQDLYPRIEKSETTVQKYAEDLDVLPPIEVNQHNELIDGWHRWTAHKRKGAASIPAIVVTTNSDVHLLELAIAANATHGLQLSQEDKRDMARRIYGGTPETEREGKKADLARILSVTERTVRNWLSRMDKDARVRRNRTIFDRWLAFDTQEVIGERVGCTQRTISNLLEASGFSKNGNFAEISKTAVSSEEEADAADDADLEAGIKEGRHRLTREQIQLAQHERDFKIPLYNVWKQQEKTPGAKHFGNTEITWLDNLLYLYTKPFDGVVDPFAGSGSTGELGRRRLRRYWISDRKPLAEGIREHDVTTGLPSVPRWQDVRLVYLDPPYWRQAAGQYSEDPTDLANMPLDEFNRTLAKLIADFGKKLPAGYIALIIQPTQWNAPERQFADHVGDMLRAVKLPVEMRFSVPYESQQCNAQMVEWAKENRRCLALTREIVVWKVS